MFMLLFAIINALFVSSFECYFDNIDLVPFDATLKNMLITQGKGG